MVQWFLLILLLIVAGVLLGREVLVFAEGRRSGAEPRRLYNRFRRRVKGVILLLLLYVLAAFFDEFERMGDFRARELLLYFGGFLVVLIWLLIVAARDFKETAHEALAERTHMALESLSAIEIEIQKHKGEARAASDDTPGKPPGRNRKKRK